MSICIWMSVSLPCTFHVAVVIVVVVVEFMLHMIANDTFSVKLTNGMSNTFELNCRLVLVWCEPCSTMNMQVFLVKCRENMNDFGFDSKHFSHFHRFLFYRPGYGIVKIDIWFNIWWYLFEFSVSKCKIIFRILIADTAIHIIYSCSLDLFGQSLISNVIFAHYFQRSNWI